jgi:hypothetical protein
MMRCLSIALHTSEQSLFYGHIQKTLKNDFPYWTCLALPKACRNSVPLQYFSFFNHNIRGSGLRRKVSQDGIWDEAME